MPLDELYLVHSKSSLACETHLSHQIFPNHILNKSHVIMIVTTTSTISNCYLREPGVVVLVDSLGVLGQTMLHSYLKKNKSCWF